MAPRCRFCYRSPFHARLIGEAARQARPSCRFEYLLAEAEKADYVVLITASPLISLDEIIIKACLSSCMPLYYYRHHIADDNHAANFPISKPLRFLKALAFKLEPLIFIYGEAEPLSGEQING